MLKKYDAKDAQRNSYFSQKANEEAYPIKANASPLTDLVVQKN